MAATATSNSAQVQFYGVGAMAGRIKPGPGVLTGPQLAYPTVLEHYPSHWGAALTVAAVTSVLRYSELGYRRILVDMLDELLEGDLHAHGVLRKVYGGIANRAWTIEPAKVDDDNERDAETAEFIAEDVHNAIASIPSWSTHVSAMLWAHYYGTTGREIMWRRDKNGWSIDRLERVHSRRISYDWDFKPFIHEADYATTGLYTSDFPGKFVIFEPQVVENYPTRQGIGRSLAYWMAFKRFTVREWLNVSERFGKPFPIIKFSTRNDGQPRLATDDDINVGKDLVVKIGKGSAPGAIVPDALDLQVVKDMAHGEGGKSIQSAFIDLCNSEESKAILANTLTTQVGSTGGNRALGEVMERGEAQLTRDLASQFDDCVTTQIIRWYVTLNYGEDKARRFCPKYVTDVNDPRDLEPDAKVLKILVDLGLKVPVSEVHERFGWREAIGDEPVLGASDMPAPPETETEPEPEPEGTGKTGEQYGIRPEKQTEADRRKGSSETPPGAKQKQTPAPPSEAATKQ